MDRKFLLTRMFLFLLLAVARPCPAQDPESPLPFPRDGEVVEHAGFPVAVRFQVVEGIGTLQFRVSTKDLSLPCYDMGTNIQALQEIHDRLAGVVEENGKRLSARSLPVTVGVRGVYDARSQAVVISRIWIPRLDEIVDCQPTDWDEFDPNRNDRLMERRDPFPPPEEPYVVEPFVQPPPEEPEHEEKEEEEEPEKWERTTSYSGYYRPSYHSYYQPPAPPAPAPPTVEDPPSPSQPAAPKSTTSFQSRKTATGRAARWGRFSRPFRNPGLSPGVKDSLNPSRLEEEEEEEPEPDAGQ